MNAPLPLVAATKVRAARSADAERWDGFVAACPEATFFHRFAWREIYQSVFKHRTHYLLAERGGDVVGILQPLRQQRDVPFVHPRGVLVPVQALEHLADQHDGNRVAGVGAGSSPRSAARIAPAQASTSPGGT